MQHVSGQIAVLWFLAMVSGIIAVPLYRNPKTHHWAMPFILVVGMCMGAMLALASMTA